MVGLLVIAAVVVFVVGILLIGEQSSLFARKNDYYILFNDVSGLNPGNPVQLNGVSVGRVTEVILPEEPGENDLRVWITVERRYADRIREDSQAQIKTLGLLGDKYIELSSGSLQAPPIPDGGQISTAPASSIDQLLASGENLMDNVTTISFSLRNILGRMERGEGILGQLTQDTPEGEQLISSTVATMESLESIAAKIETGDGALPRLLNDAELAERVEGSLDRLESVLAKADEGEGMLPKLLNDPESARQVDEVLANLRETSESLRRLSDEIETSEGLVQRLLTDEEYGRQVSEEIRAIVERVDVASRQITEGDNTLARLINDDSLYTAVEDILVGVNESRLLRWLIRNRQEAGIERRYEDAVEAGEVEPLPRGQEVPPVEPEAPAPESGPRDEPNEPRSEPQNAPRDTPQGEPLGGPAGEPAPPPEPPPSGGSR
ncbi:MAG TPA: MlaD family protein [Thermoanaerobaculia bacterium]|nr:MlaD family protein [Thermoanaerobaculia bacterium]